MNTYEYWDIYYINWCRISSINSINTFHIHLTSSFKHRYRQKLWLPCRLHHDD